MKKWINKSIFCLILRNFTLTPNKSLEHRWKWCVLIDSSQTWYYLKHITGWKLLPVKLQRVDMCLICAGTITKENDQVFLSDHAMCYVITTIFVSRNRNKISWLMPIWLGHVGNVPQGENFWQLGKNKVGMCISWTDTKTKENAWNLCLLWWNVLLISASTINYIRAHLNINSIMRWSK